METKLNNWALSFLGGGGGRCQGKAAVGWLSLRP